MGLASESPTEASTEEGRAESSQLESLLREAARLPDAVPPEPEPDRRGQHLAQFRIGAKIGQGGMGIVYLADDLKLRRRVALKVLPIALFADQERRARFLREARSASAVLHPNLATVFDVGESEDTAFIAMEHVDGATLRHLLTERAGGLDLCEAVRIVADVARGVGRAHRAGVVHRDLKPENVIVARDGVVKVLDFGLAKIAEVTESEPSDGTPAEDDPVGSRAGRIVGTPGYMSPEQAAGAAVDARSDVFSLGVMLWEMVHGARPFRGATGELLKAIQTEPPRAPRKEEGGRAIPAALARILDKCLRKAPHERFEDAGELALELDRIRAELLARHTERGRAWWLAAVVIALAVGFATWLALSLRPAGPDAGVLEPAPPMALRAEATIALDSSAAVAPSSTAPIAETSPSGGRPSAAMRGIPPGIVRSAAAPTAPSVSAASPKAAIPSMTTTASSSPPPAGRHSPVGISGHVPF